MATCPRCNRRDAFTLDATGDSVIVAAPLGTFSLAGAQPKVPAHAVTEIRLTCEGCGWGVTGYIEEGHLVEHPPGQTPETAVPRERGGGAE